MDIVKTLEKSKAEMEKKFEQLNQQKQKLQTSLAQTAREMERLQGEYNGAEKLLTEFKDTK